jgi:hypothetical protein
MGTQVLMFCRMRKWRKEILALVDMQFHVFDALCKRFGTCLVGDDGPPPAVRVHNNQKADMNGQDRGGDDSKGDDEDGKGDGGRGYEDDGGDGDDNGGDGGSIRRLTRQLNVAVMTARATTKTARATVAGAMRTTAAKVATATTATTAAAPNGDKHINQILSRQQQQGTW